MGNTSFTFSKLCQLTSTLLIFSALLLLPGSASAGTDWWQKGTDLLKDMGQSTTPSSLASQEIAAGLKEALRVGTQNVVGQLGRTDGFNKDPAIHIPLPKSLESVKTVLDKTGGAYLLDDLELKLNRAAEVAAPKARAIFGQAISEMTLDDARKIYDGPDDAATRYFQGKMTKPLAAEMAPVVNDSLSEVGAVQSYDNVMGQYQALPFVPDAKADLTEYVVTKGMDGIFHYLAKEEAAIRQNPLKRSTELLQKVFGAQ